MQVLFVKKPGADSKFVLEEWDMPIPKETEVLVQVKCFGLNRMDIAQRNGTYPVPLPEKSLIGVEVSGIVQSTGKNVTLFKPGDAVFGLLPAGGGYAEYAVMEECLAMHKPEKLTFEEASSIPETWFVAYQALHLVGEMRKGESVLIHAGASGVGVAGIQLAKEAEAQVLVYKPWADLLIPFLLSPEEVFTLLYKRIKLQNSQLEKQELTNDKGVDIIIDFVGRDYWKHNIDSLAIDGRMVILAYLSGPDIENMHISDFVIKRISIRGSNLRDRSLKYQSELRNQVYNNVVLKHFAREDGKLKVIVNKVFQWEDIADAHHYLESNKSIGKIVVRITSNQ
ncbi:hypothetical protein G6F37_002478 [Rhizopus arrhizus]|nr:hypothetical protein G6F38_000367 [Rhizopus arrhizus]KAG1162075.1 hypothetical protein G6F37_002478 [Rhizopus arrhizus]